MHMRNPKVFWAVAWLASVPAAALGQVPMPGHDADPPSVLTATVLAAIKSAASGYPLVGVKLYARDSALLVFDDSTLTFAKLRAHSWTFGPAPTAAEAEGCPPEKVLGRKIARAFFSALGRPTELDHVIVLVRGTRDLERWTASGMYYFRPQLSGAWAGDSLP